MAADAFNAAEKEVKSFNESLDEVNKSLADSDSNFASYKHAIDTAAEGTKQRKIAIEEFNKAFGSYLSNMLTESSTAEELAKAYADVNTQLRARVVNEAKANDIKANVNPAIASQQEWQDKYQHAIEQSNHSGWTSAQMMNQVEQLIADGYSGEEIAKRIAEELELTDYTASRAYAARNKPIEYAQDSNGKSYVKNVYGTIYSGNRQMSKEEEALNYAVRYADAVEKQNDILARIDKKYSGYDELLKKAIEVAPESKSSPELQDAKNKQEAKAARQQAQQQLSAAKGEVQSIMGKIRAFYEAQIAEVTRQATANGGDMSEAMQQQYIDTIRERYLAAMSEARKAIRGVDNHWAEFVESMPDDIKTGMVDGVNISDYLLEQIKGVDIANVRKAIINLTNQLHPGSGLSVIDDVLAQAMVNEKQIANIENKAMRARIDEAMKRDYVSQVNSEYLNRMDRLGLPAMSKEEQIVFAGGGELQKSLVKSRSEEMTAMFQRAHQSITSILAIDPSVEGSNGLIANVLFGADPNALSSVAQSMRTSVLKMSESEIKLFYDNLLEYSEQYYEAVEKRDNELLKRIKSAWRRDDVKRLFDQRIQQLTLAARQYMAAGQQGKNNVTYRQQPKNTRTQYGFADNIDKDPEVQLIYKKMQLEQAYLNFMIANHATKEQLADQEAKVYEAQAAMADAVTKRIDERFTALRKWVEPIEAMGTAVGDAFATMTDSAEDGRKALINALKAMLQAYGQMSIQMVSDNLNDRLRARNKARGVEATTNTADVGKSVASSVVGSAQSAISTAVGGASQPGATDPNAAPEVQSRVNIDNALYQEQLSHNQRTEEEERRHQEEMARLKGQPSPASDASTGPSASPDVTTATVPSASPDGSEKDEKAAAKETLKSYGLQSAEAALKKGLNRLFNLKRRAKRKELKLEREYQSQETDVVEQGGEAQLGFTETFQGEMADVTQQVSQKIVTTKQQAAQANMQTEMAEAQGTTAAGVAEGASQTIGQLGWWGIPLVAVITALLNGLLAFAMSKFSSLFGGSSSGSSSNTKLVSGMLTYDRGNVQQFASLTDRTKARRITESDLLRASQAYADGDMSAASRLVVGDDGNIYDAQAAGALMTGIVSSPTTTTIGGQPALVGERGPEMVIGRETTRALQLARPDLLAEIIRFDRNHSGAGFRAYDRGNVVSFDSQSIDAQASSQPSTQFDAAALTATISTLQRTLADLQRTGIQASINMYGSDGLHSRLRQADRFMSGK